MFLVCFVSTWKVENKWYNCDEKILIDNLLLRSYKTSLNLNTLGVDFWIGVWLVLLRRRCSLYRFAIINFLTGSKTSWFGCLALYLVLLLSCQTWYQSCTQWEPSIWQAQLLFPQISRFFFIYFLPSSFSFGYKLLSFYNLRFHILF